VNAYVTRRIGILLLVFGAALFGQDEGAPLAPVPSASLTISVMAEETGEAVAEAKVQVRGGSVGTTDPDGICLLDGLPARRCQVTVSKEEFATAYLYVNLEPGKEAAMKIALDPEGKIVGIVTNEFGEILPDATCSVYTPDGHKEREKLDENGLFTVDGLSAKKDYTLYVSHQDYCTRILRDVKIPEDTRLLTLEISLDMGAVVKGQVTDSRGGPLQGAQVTASGSRSGAETDAEGMYVLQRLEPKETWVRVSAPGCAPERRQVVPSRMGATLNFRLFPGHRIVGRVVDEEGKPVAGAHVRAYAGYFGSLGEMQTDPEGTFRLDSLPEGKAYLYVYAEGYSNPYTTINTDQKDVSITLYRAGHILGKVTTKAGEPVTEFRVFLSTLGARSGERRGSYPRGFPTQTGMAAISPTGEFEIPGTTTGAPYKVTIVTRDYAPETVPRVMGRSLDSRDRETIVVEKGVAFAGKVLDLSTGSAVPGAEIVLSVQSTKPGRYSSKSRSRPRTMGRLAAGSLTCSSGEGGVFEMSNVAPRSYYVLVTHPDYADLQLGRLSFAAGAGRKARQPDYAALPPATEKGIEGAVLKLSKGASIVGHAYEAEGKPLVGARVVLSGRNRYATTDEQGAYRFDKLPPGRYSVTLYPITSSGVAKGGRTYRTVSVELSDDEDKVLDFRPFDGITLTGRLTGDKKLRKKARVRVQSRGDDAVSVNVVPDSKGRFSVRGLQPGRYTVSAVRYASRRWSTLATRSVTVSEKKAPTVVLRLGE